MATEIDWELVLMFLGANAGFNLPALLMIPAAYELQSKVYGHEGATDEQIHKTLAGYRCAFSTIGMIVGLAILYDRGAIQPWVPWAVLPATIFLSYRLHLADLAWRYPRRPPKIR